MPLRILAIDDEPDILRAFKTLVEPLGYEVVMMADSQEAARLLNNESFVGVFVDAQMPHLDGFELTKLVRASPVNAKAPIVMITGHDDGETMRRTFKAGVTFFLGKPFTRDRVRGLFNAALGLLMNERRRSPRLPLRTTVRCRWSDRDVNGTSVNISESGMLLELSGEVAVGQQVDVEFLIPLASEPVRTRVKIVRKEHPDLVGLRFLSLTPAERIGIQRYITGL